MWLTCLFCVPQQQLSVSPVVSKAGNLLQSRINELALCIAYPESVQKSGLSLSSVEKKEPKVVDSSVRFSTKECGHPSLEVTDLMFSVDKPVMLCGVTLYGGMDASYKYKLSLIWHSESKKPFAEVEGSFSQSDYYGESFVDVKFKQPVKLEVSSPSISNCMCAIIILTSSLTTFVVLCHLSQAELVYTAHVELVGQGFDIGVDGKTSLTGPGGVTFTLHAAVDPVSDPQSGPLVKFLYSQYVHIVHLLCRRDGCTRGTFQWLCLLRLL